MIPILSLPLTSLTALFGGAFLDSSTAEVYDVWWAGVVGSLPGGLQPGRHVPVIGWETVNLTWLDLVTAALIVAGAFRGFKRGLIREGMAFAGLAVGIVLAGRWQDVAANSLEPFVGGGAVLHGLAYLLIVLGALICATLVTVLLQRLARLLWVGWVDRIGGVLIGAVQGGVVATLALFLLVKYPILGIDRAVMASGIAPHLVALVAPAVSFLPPELAPVARFFELPKK